MQRPDRDIEDPQQFAHMLLKRLHLDGDRQAFREAEDVILEAMNEALNHARDAVARNPRWGVEAIEAIKNRLNNPK
jgi:hypothetical protein